jgi:multidrug efflux pump subunit AcrA (membrane-fusion protein)
MGKTAIVILGENNFKIEVLVSEADISKIKVGQNALITLDSYGENVKFNGIVNFIEPAETVIQEVVYYKTIVLFTDQDISYTIKSGMTANVTVSTNGRENVLMISSRAVLDKNNDGKYVRVLTDNQEVVEKEIKLGISGDDGLVEVLSGISAGDSIITKITEN